MSVSEKKADRTDAVNHVHSHDHIHSHHDHGDGVSNLSPTQFTFVVLLNLGITLAEIIGGLIAGSLALVSDAMHNLSDSLSLVISYFAFKLSGKSANTRKTFGYKRANIVAALFNASTLLIIGVLLIREAIERFVNPVEINSEIVLVVGTIGLIANLLSMVILRRWSKSSLNIRSAYLHMLTDALSSVAVLIGAVMIWIFDLKFIDPILTIGISLYLLKESFEILRESVSILMQSAPSEIEVERVVRKLNEIENIKDIHHVHIWRLDEKSIFFEGHVNLTEDITVSKSMEIYEKIKHELDEEFGITHVTIQFEYNGCSASGVIDCK
ncbi:cobalt-zinc-cadmium efflux system protein [Fervidobacterium gondwanense DSM 13020]|uniref:Cobalt-zinc-cadmium efflux system protein n=1 Tax=Fervidobacterium gondwanense DSM 13020 TaxID=1121883 RepID=A0A1M7TC13_FERGO|nr:cobalt-zinc-cadmium efflux system protein [Fervidobacterium gondwanense DSM 13020]